VMEVQPLIVRPSLFGVAEVFGRVLIFWYHDSKLRLIQIHIAAPRQQENDNKRTDSYPLHITPFEVSILIYISAITRKGF
jgi:hypothetical protein